MARQLIDNLAAEWKPEKYTDEYKDNLMRVINAKLKGKKPKLIDEDHTPKQAEVVDLMARLRASLEGGSEARRAGSPKKPAASKGTETRAPTPAAWLDKLPTPESLSFGSSALGSLGVGASGVDMLDHYPDRYSCRHRLVPPQPRADRGDLRSDRSGGVLQPADLAAQPHRLLRGAPAGLQRDRVPAARARAAAGGRAAREAVRARHRSRDRGRPPCRAAARRPCGRRATRSAPSRARATRPSSPRWRRCRPGRVAARRALHRARARGDAPGNAPLYVASAAV